MAPWRATQAQRAHRGKKGAVSACGHAGIRGAGVASSSPVRTWRAALTGDQRSERRAATYTDTYQSANICRTFIRRRGGRRHPRSRPRTLPRGAPAAAAAMPYSGSASQFANVRRAEGAPAAARGQNAPARRAPQGRCSALGMHPAPLLPPRARAAALGGGQPRRGGACALNPAS